MRAPRLAPVVARPASVPMLSLLSHRLRNGRSTRLATTNNSYGREIFDTNASSEALLTVRSKAPTVVGKSGD